MKRTLAVDLNGLRLAVPVVAASGSFGTGRELAGLLDPHRLGAAVTRSITLQPRKGTPTPRVAETPSGVLSAVGLQNPGIEAFLAEELPRLARSGAPVIVSIAGGSLEEYVRLASLLNDAPGVAGIETYLSCADEGREETPFTSSPDHAAEVVGAVSRLSHLPVFAKLPYGLTELVETARSCARAGAHGLTLIDGVPAMAIDPERLRPALGSVTGFLSGPAVRPLALRAVFDVARAMPEVPIFGAGGVATGRDALEFLLAGAWAVQVGTALLVDPAAPGVIAQGIMRYLKEKGLASPADLRGRVRVPEPVRQREGG